MPPVTAVLAWLILGETLNLRELVGLVVTVVAVGAATRTRAPEDVRTGRSDARVTDRAMQEYPVNRGSMACWGVATPEETMSTRLTGYSGSPRRLGARALVRYLFREPCGAVTGCFDHHRVARSRHPCDQYGPLHATRRGDPALARTQGVLNARFRS